MNSTTSQINELLERLATAGQQARTVQGPLIHVSELTSFPAFVYEKLRNIVDYKDEYLLRKNAVKRFLKRRFLLPQFTHETMVVAQSLVRELILSRYLANDSVAESLLPKLAAVLSRYQALFNQLESQGCKASRWREQMLGLAAVECDALLVSPAERNAYNHYAFRLLKPLIGLSRSNDSEEEKDMQLMLAIQRVLERADRDITSYSLLKHYYSAWFNLPPQEAAQTLAPHYAEALQKFERLSNYRLGRRLLPTVKRLLVPLMILRDVVREYDGPLRELLKNPKDLERKASETYRSLWLQTRRRIRRKGFHAMGYIFLTKILVALLLELPYERLVIGSINYLPLGINLAFPPFLMAIITLLIKSPTDKNEILVVQGVHEIAYGGEAEFFLYRELKIQPPSFWKHLTYIVLYTVTTGVSLGALIYLLWRLNFNPISGALFMLFVSLVSFFGISLRQQARQLKVISGRETMVGFLVDFFTFPVMALGKWISTTFDRVNIFVFVLDFLFEVPFKTALKLIEDWFAFLKEKKEDLY